MSEFITNSDHDQELGKFLTNASHFQETGGMNVGYRRGWFTPEKPEGF